MQYFHTKNPKGPSGCLVYLRLLSAKTDIGRRGSTAHISNSYTYIHICRPSFSVRQQNIFYFIYWVYLCSEHTYDSVRSWIYYISWKRSLLCMKTSTTLYSKIFQFYFVQFISDWLECTHSINWSCAALIYIVNCVCSLPFSYELQL